MKNERYKRNRERVYDIYGIPKKDRGTKYNMHHIVFRSDLGKLVSEDFDLDCKSNLYPLRKDVHQELHNKVEKYGKRKRRKKS